MTVGQFLLAAYSAPCYNFLHDAREEKRTVWLAPYIIKELGGKIMVTWGCSLGKSCECAACIYARGTRSPSEES